MVYALSASEGEALAILGDDFNHTDLETVRLPPSLYGSSNVPLEICLQSFMALDPKRTVAELKHLRTLTGDENGAQRVAWTDTWLKSREWLRAKLDELPLETHMDEAGNVWSTLKGESDKVLIIGGHMDSVP